MQLKINKDALMRHRFWVMVGVAMFLSLTGILYLQFTDAEATREKLTKEYKDGKGVQPTANAATIGKLTDFAKMTMEQETRIWKKAFDLQKAEFRWHNKVEDEFNFYEGLFAIQVKILDPKTKAPAKVDEWPKETMVNVTHGEIVSVDQDLNPNFFMMKGRDGFVRKFFRTPTNNFLTIGTPDPKAPPAFKELNNHLGKLAAVTFQTGRYFGDTLTDREQKAFLDSYAEQVREVLLSVDPYTDKGTGLVQLKDWPYREDALPEKEKTFIRYVPFADIGKQLSKEIWISQENIWIQREIYSMIASANDSISKFDDKGEDQTKIRTFVNPYFEVRMALDPAKNNALTFILKNLTSRRQKLDLTFKVKTRGPGKNDGAESIYVSGNPLMPMGSKPVKQGETVVSDTIRLEFPATAETPRKGIFGLTQELNYQTAAVKRIDYISIGSTDEKSGYSHSHRTFPDGLKSLEDANPVKPQIGMPIKPADPGVPPGDGGFGRGPVGGVAGGNKKPLDYDLWTERYLEPPDQTRRVPICVSLIIDQDHVDRVMTKFNNSKLRLLLTQALLNQYTGSVAPPAPAVDPKDGPKFVPNPFAPGPIRPIGPMGPFGPGGPIAPAAGGGDSDNSMELVIYGVMTLYQRYPPRPPMPADVK